ncbi:hypothetical protein [Microcoleus sp. herbarium12]
MVFLATSIEGLYLYAGKGKVKFNFTCRPSIAPAAIAFCQQTEN